MTTYDYEVIILRLGNTLCKMGYKTPSPLTSYYFRYAIKYGVLNGQ